MHFIQVVVDALFLQVAISHLKFWLKEIELYYRTSELAVHFPHK